MLNFRDIRACYFNIRPPLVNPLFNPFQRLPGDLLVRADGDKSKHPDCSIILAVYLGTGNVKAIPRPTEDALDDAPFFFQRMGREGKMNIKTEDEHP